MELVETTGTWPEGLLVAYIALIPKADGDSTLGQRPLSVLPVLYRLWASLRLGHLQEWVEGGYLSRLLVLVMVSLLWKPGSLQHWTLRRFFLGLVVISCMSWLLMSLSPVILLIGPFWIVHWDAWGCLIGFVRSIFLFIVRFVSGFKLAAGFGESWCRDGGILQGCPLRIFLLWLFMSLGVVIWMLCLMLSLSCMLIILCVVLSVLVPYLNLLGSLLSMSGQLVRTFLLLSVSFSVLLSLLGKL